MEKNYYPLRVGKTLGTIVSNIPTRIYIDETDADSEMKHYGGYFICESVITQTLAKQLVDAYNEKYRCEADHSKPCIGGKTCCQQKCKCPVDYVDVIKVIEDLKELAEELNTEIAISEHPAIQNAEAALGMLQAFNIPVKDNGVNNSESIKNKLASMLRNTDNMGEASAIIWAIGEMIKIKNGI